MNEQEKIEQRLEDLQLSLRDALHEVGHIRQEFCAHSWVHNFVPDVEVDTECSKCKLICKHERIENKCCVRCHITMGILDD